jgi:magnesium transporter
MLTKHPSSADASGAVWIDLLNPSDEERALVEQVTHLRVPTQDEISEIEFSSRVYIEKGALHLSTPVLDGNDLMSSALTPVGFVLSAKHLVTLRFTQIAVIERLLSATGEEGVEANPREAFLKILEAFVDHAADSFERASALLEQVSNAAFRDERSRPSQVARASHELHAGLRKLGRMDDGISHVRDTLLGIGRIIAFVLDGDCNQRLVDAGPRLQSIRADVASLNDYQVHLSGKVQFLLDATLGFISIQQNDIVKTLTIVSVVGVPPVLIAGIYGMNFKYMPELGWAFGYPAALILIVVSGLVPIAWFKWRGWM